jgi:hypothetical protein
VKLSRIIIQESDDEIANTATKNLVKKLQKKYNKEDIVVIKRVNEALVVTEGNMTYSGAAFVFLRFINLRFLIICSGTKAMLLFGLGC